MRYLVLVLALALTACDSAESTNVLKKQTLSFDDLERIPMDCNQRYLAQDKIKRILMSKSYPANPDLLNEIDRAYQSKLKATYWWFEYSCGEAK